MDWSKGFSAKYIVTKVDPGTWGDSGEVEVTDGTITRDMESDLLESASLTVKEPIGEQWIRVYLLATQNGETVREPLFTGLSTTPTRHITGRQEENTLDCYSVLKVADDVLLPLGYFAAAGTQGSLLIKQLLTDLPGEVVIRSGSPYLSNNIVSGLSDSKLKMVRLIADAIDWRIRIDAKGIVYVEPKTSKVDAYFNSQDQDVIEPSVNDDNDVFGIPNVLRVTLNGSTVTVRNDDKESDSSTVNRGREVWKSENISSLSDAESLAAYAVRRLRELQSPARTLSYSRRFHPDVVPGSLVRISYPLQGLNGTFRVQSQDISLGFNAKTEEDAVYEY